MTLTGAGQTLTYDGNGNLTGDGTRTFTWDAENRLITVTLGSHTSTFTYDGLDRRVRMLETDGGTPTSDTRFLWCGLEICEQRDSTGATVTKRYFAEGVQDGGIAYFYTRDHLGSVRELTDSTGTVRARYDYDPWGRRTKVSGDKDADAGYTGHYQHTPSGLTLAPFRGYDAGFGRWLSEDPIGLKGGPNLYVYGANDPILRVDRLGFQSAPTRPDAPRTPFEEWWYNVWGTLLSEVNHVSEELPVTTTTAPGTGVLGGPATVVGTGLGMLTGGKALLDVLPVVKKKNQDLDKTCTETGLCGPPLVPPKRATPQQCSK